MDAKADTAAATFGALKTFVRDFVASSGRRFYVATALVALGAIFESVGLVLLVPLLALVTRSGPGNGLIQRAVEPAFGLLGVSNTMGRLATLLAAFVALIALRGLVILRRDIDVQVLQWDFVEKLRSRIMQALASAGWEHVLRLRHARIIHIMSGDIQRISGASYFLLQSGISVVFLVFQCALAFWLAPMLAALTLVLLVIGAFALIPMLRKARMIGAYVTDANLSLLDATSQFLNGLKLAISQNLQSSFASEFHQTLVALRDRQVHYFRQQAGGRVALTTLSALVGAVAVLVGYGMLGIDAPVMIAFLLIVARMSAPASLIQQGIQQVAFGLPAYEKTIALLGELKPAPIGKTIVATLAEGPILFEGVTYLHEPDLEDAGDMRGIRAVSLRIAPQTFVGIEGASGTGKTTLLDVLVGLLWPQAGRVTIGGTALDDTTLPAWRGRLSYVTQDAFLFHESVRRNLLWANPGASEQDLWDALALTGADVVVRRMSKGLDTVVGERGSLLSGGERQRIALSRALLRKPRLLVMDEATNAIDIDSEHALLTALRAIRPAMTIVMVAHRRESLSLCDEILALSDAAPRREPALAHVR